jgi:hypothetical protein
VVLLKFRGLVVVLVVLVVEVVGLVPVSVVV